MKLHKAIEILSDPHYLSYTTVNRDFPDALRLGIEALNRLQDRRGFDIPADLNLLPGEDPETPTRRSLHAIKAVQESPLGREPKG